MKKVRFPVTPVLLAVMLLILGSCQDRPASVVQNETPSEKMPPPPPAPRAPTAAERDSIQAAGVFSFTDTMPSFPGGEVALKHYLSAHVRYPAPARENGHQGTVVVQFNVEPNGSLDHVVAMDNHLDASLGVEAVRLVSGMPRWNPGYKDGKAVAVRYSLPVRFVLQ